MNVIRCLAHKTRNISSRERIDQQLEIVRGILGNCLLRTFNLSAYERRNLQSQNKNRQYERGVGPSGM